MSWVEAGLDPERFWALTLREIDVILRGAGRRIEREKVFLDQLAWHTARLSMVGWHAPRKFPDFQRAFGRGRRPSGRKRPWAQMLGMIRTLNAAMGGRPEKGE